MAVRMGIGQLQVYLMSELNIQLRTRTYLLEQVGVDPLHIPSLRQVLVLPPLSV